MVQGGATPLVFGIGLPHSGGRIFAPQFQANGYKWRHSMSGKLAVDAAYAFATGGNPARKWPGAAGYSGLFRVDKINLPPLRVQDLVPKLLQHFPDAYFIHTHRNQADWITARYLANDGSHRTASALHAGVAEADLLDL